MQVRFDFSKHIMTSKTCNGRAGSSLIIIIIRAVVKQKNEGYCEKIEHEFTSVRKRNEIFFDTTNDLLRCWELNLHVGNK